MRKRPWHDDARRLRAAGCTYILISKEVGKSLTSVLKLFNEKYARNQRKAKTEAARRKYNTDPENRAKRKAAVVKAQAAARLKRSMTGGVFE